MKINEKLTALAKRVIPTVIIAFILFLLINVITVDLIDDFIERDITANLVSEISSINYITTIYMLALIVAFIISVIYTRENKGVSLVSMGLATVTSLAWANGLGILGLVAFNPSLEINFGTFILGSVILLIIIGNPVIYFTIIALIFVIFNEIFYGLLGD